MKTLEELRKVFVEARKLALAGDPAKIDSVAKNLSILSAHCQELIVYETEFNERVKAQRIYNNIEKVRVELLKDGYNSNLVIKFFGLHPKKVETPVTPVNDDVFSVYDVDQNRPNDDVFSVYDVGQNRPNDDVFSVYDVDQNRPNDDAFSAYDTDSNDSYSDVFGQYAGYKDNSNEDSNVIVDDGQPETTYEQPIETLVVENDPFANVDDPASPIDDLPMVKLPVTETSIPEKHDSNQESDSPEAKILESGNVNNSEFKFDWDSLPSINFEDVAGLETVKETVKIKVLLPLKNPEAFEGYVKKNGGGLLLYGPPGTGKTMIAAAIANEIGAKFCSVKPSDLIHQGAGQSEKAVRALFAQARSFPCSVIYFDEMDSISPKTTRSQYAKQMRSELLAQLQGIDSYKKENEHILFLIAATNKPWEIDSAFLRPGRFGTRIYVGLPDSPARKYMFEKRLEKIKAKGLVSVNADIDMDALVAATEGFNGSDISNLIDRVEEISILRGIESGEKYISYADFELALSEIPSSVQREDIEKLMEWKAEI